MDETYGKFEDILAAAKPELRPVRESLRRQIASLHKGFVEVVWRMPPATRCFARRSPTASAMRAKPDRAAAGNCSADRTVLTEPGPMRQTNCAELRWR
jgi:hypothetical protein